MSLPCVAILAVSLYHVASVYAQCLHANAETPESPVFYGDCNKLSY